MEEKAVKQIVFSDFENNASFIDATTVHFVVSPQIKSPMNGNAAAFSSEKQAATMLARTGGEMVTWNGFRESNAKSE